MKTTSTTAAKSKGSNPHPNVLFIMTDQHRFDFLGCHDHPMVKTPNIDRLAAHGVDFQRCYSQSAICMPSRVSALTGQYPHTTGIQHNSRIADVSHLTMLPRILGEQGYQTAAVGKTHCGPCEVVGFDRARLCAGIAESETNAYKEYLKSLGLDRPQNQSQAKAYDAYVDDLPYEHSVEAWTANESLKFLESRNKESPFFLWMSFERPHAPTCVPSDNPFPYNPDDVVLEDWSAGHYTNEGTRRPGCEAAWNQLCTGPDKLREAIANYCSLISMIDDQIGRVLNFLEAEGTLENTLIIFTADHGEFGGRFGQFGKNTNTYEDLYRIPFIWSWKGRTDHEQPHELVELIDLMPTVLEFAGIPCPRTVQGRSLGNAINGSLTRRGIPWDGKEAVFYETPFVKTVRTRRYKLSVCHKGAEHWGRLYDLLSDPREADNLYGQPEHQWIQRELENRLLRWFIETQQPQVHGCGVDETAPHLRWYLPSETDRNFSAETKP